MMNAERETQRRKIPKVKQVSEVETLSKEELALQLRDISHYAYQVSDENKELRNKLSTIHNRIIEMWKYDFHIDPEISRGVAKLYHVHLENAEFRSKIDDTIEVINALTKTRRYKPSEEEIYQTLLQEKKKAEEKEYLLEREKEQHLMSKELMQLKDREIERLKEELKQEREKKVPIQVKGQGIKIVIKDKNETPVEETVHIEEKLDIKQIENYPLGKEQEVVEMDEQLLIEKAEDMLMYNLLEPYNPKPPSNPIYDCDIEYEGKLAAVYFVKDVAGDEKVFEEIAKKTNKIFFVGDSEKFYNKEISPKFLTWMIKTGRANEVEHSFTLQNRLLETRELKKLRKL